MKLLLTIVGLLCAVRVAEAKGSPATAAAKTLLDAQVAAITAHDAKAFAATFDEPAYAVFPTTLEARASAKIAIAAKTWLDGLGKTQVVLDHPRFGDLEFTGCAWISAELVATGDTTVRWRVTELVAPLQAGVEKPTAADFRVLAAMISEPMDDKASLTATLPALPEVHNDHDPATEVAGVRILFDLQVLDDPAVTFVGSAPKELKVGKAAVAAMVKSFKGLDMKALTLDYAGDMNSMNTATAEFEHVQVTYKVGGKAIVVPYRVMLIVASPGTGGHGVGKLGVAHFSIAQR